jgi:hypothetical protein
LREYPSGFVKLLGAVSFLSREQRWVLAIIALLLLTGWAVKAYRAAHPPVVVQKPMPPVVR